MLLRLSVNGHCGLGRNDLHSRPWQSGQIQLWN